MSLDMKKYEKILGLIAALILVFGIFIKYRHSNQINEATRLPFYSVELSDVEDGVYSGKTYTEFMHFQVEVEVENHQLKNIHIIENSGSQGIKAKELVQKMVAENKVKVPVFEKDELGGLVVISCVDSALFNGLSDELKDKYK